MFSGRLPRATRSAGFAGRGMPYLPDSLYPAPDFAHDFLRSPDPIIGGGTTTKSVDANGTFVNSSGLITQKTANVWPLDYDPITLQPRGRPVWEARTNLVLQSLAFDNAAWTKTDTTVTADAIASPDGTANADLLTEGSAGTALVTQGALTITAGATVTCSLFVKRGNHDWSLLTVANNVASTGFRAWINTGTGALGTAGTLGTGTLVSSTIEPYPNGWYRVVLVGTIDPATTTAVSAFYHSASANNSGTRVNGATRYVWGGDLGPGAFGTPFIPTLGATVTRAKDQLSLANPSVVSQSAGTYLIEARTGPGNATEYFLSVDDGTANNRIAVFRNALNEIHVLIVSGGVTQADITAGTVADNTTFKVSFAYAANSAAASLNGAAAVTGSPASLPATITHNLGQDHSAGNQANGWLRKLAYWRRRSLAQSDDFLRDLATSGF